MGDTLRSNREIVLAAVRQNAHALRCALGGLDDDEEVVRVAVRENGRALQYASDRIRKDKNFVLEALGFEGCALEYALGDLLGRKLVPNLASKGRFLCMYRAEHSLESQAGSPLCQPIHIHLKAEQIG